MVPPAPHTPSAVPRAPQRTPGRAQRLRLVASGARHVGAGAPTAVHGPHPGGCRGPGRREASVLGTDFRHDREGAWARGTM
jgi:hypothetical protein